MDKALKQRLVGAVVLIALAVIVLPMIFGGRPSSGPEARTIELPAEPPDLEFETRRFPVDSDRPQAAERTDGDAQAPTLPRPGGSTTTASDSDATAPAPAQSPVDEPVAGNEEVPPREVVEVVDAPDSEDDAQAEEAAGDRMDNLVASLMENEPSVQSTRYVVQVASFGNRENATRMASQLESSGYAVLLDNVSAETGSLNRVRVGPYGTESEAQRVATQLGEQFSGINPRIVDMQPDAAGPALASDDPLLRWVVQVGSFSSRENARDLVARLRETGLSAYDETVTTDTSTIYRVRVGPYLDRDEALRTEQSIADGMGIDGVVMSAD